MSVETLSAPEMEAGFALGLSMGAIDTIHEIRRVHVFDLGELAVAREADGRVMKIQAWRGIVGPEGYMSKGGSRMTNRDPLGDLHALPVDMYDKSHQVGLTDPWGRPVNGAKLLFHVDPTNLTHLEKRRAFAAAATAMYDRGIAGHDKSVPAGDMGTNHTDLMDDFAARICELGDPLGRGSITGKSVEMGGLKFRPHATGYGVYKAVQYMREELGLKQARITISGAGNVGGYLGYYASQPGEHLSVRGYSDIGGTLQANGDIKVSEALMDIMDNSDFAHDPRYAEFNGNKLLAMQAQLAKDQPTLEVQVSKDSNDILGVESDIFVPASVRNLITGNTAPKLRARAIVEAGNDTIDQDGYNYLLGRKTPVAVVPGTIANAGGVGSSMDEHRGNVRGETYDFTTAKDMAEVSAVARLARLNTAAELLGTHDYRHAATALGMASMALQLGHNVAAEFRDLVSPRTA